MAAQEKQIVETKTVKCDGGSGPLGHPAVYLTFGDKEKIECPYCSKIFVIKKLKK